MSPVKPFRGEVWDCDLSPTRGHEQSGRRPVLIVSSDRFNQGKSSLVVIVPITSTPARNPLHVPMSADEGGLNNDSALLCDMVRSVSQSRLSGTGRGRVSPETLVRVEQILRIIQQL
jgi:mRNA interferase MazF